MKSKGEIYLENYKIITGNLETNSRIMDNKKEMRLDNKIN